VTGTTSTSTSKSPDDFLGTQELREELLADKKDLGRRGEPLTIAQVIAFLLVLFPPVKLNGLFEFLALGLIVAGITFGIYGFYSLGRNFSPLPTPRTKHKLVTHGAYAYCRHPLYGGLIMVSLGLAAYTFSEARLLFTIIMCFILSVKSKAEEVALTALYGEEYKAYEAKVSKFIPYLY
jgi:protein-S-isoprenylcysteine O-methyltransferase Ste14